MEIDKDIAGYAAAASRHGEATMAGNSDSANAAYRELVWYWKRIQLSDTDWRPAFFALLADKDPWVRLWTASHSIHTDPDRAVPVLKALSVEPGFVGFDAQMTLETWQKGQLGECN